jgi:hypothetical protein
MVMRTVVISNRDRPGKTKGARVVPVSTRRTSFVGDYIRSECLQGAPDQPDRTIGVTAGPAPTHLAEAADEAWHEIRAGLASSQMGQVISNGGKPEDARAALSRALVGQESSDAGRLRDAARFGSQHNDDSDPG